MKAAYGKRTSEFLRKRQNILKLLTHTVHVPAVFMTKMSAP